MTYTCRKDHLTSQHVEVALVYREMLGVTDAMEYLRREGISNAVAERVLLTDCRRGMRQPAFAPAFPAEGQMACRRRNHVHDAIVEAALKIERKLGAATALTLLEQEQVPDSVVARVLAEGPRQLRVKERRG